MDGISLHQRSRSSLDGGLSVTSGLPSSHYQMWQPSSFTKVLVTVLGGFRKTGYSPKKKHSGWIFHEPSSYFLGPPWLWTSHDFPIEIQEIDHPNSGLMMIFKPKSLDPAQPRAPGVVRVPSESEVPKGSALHSKTYYFLGVPKRKPPKW